MKKDSRWIVESLMEQGYSIDESLDALKKAKRRIKSIRKFVNTEAETMGLKDAFQKRENLMEELHESARGQ